MSYRLRYCESKKVKTEHFSLQYNLLSSFISKWQSQYSCGSPLLGKNYDDECVQK